jgi:hypothetical protein
VLAGDDVALKIQADIDRFSVPHSGSAPDALIVLFQATNIGVALRLDAGPGLTFGEAVRAGDRRTGIISVLADGEMQDAIDGLGAPEVLMNQS